MSKPGAVVKINKKSGGGGGGGGQGAGITSDIESANACLISDNATTIYIIMC